jgi:hypothetical protein
MAGGVHIYGKVVEAITGGSDVSHVVESEAKRVTARANAMARQSGWGMDADPYGHVVKDGLGIVAARNINNSHNAANAENAKHNTLKKALGV